MPTEIELKLAINAADAESLRQLPLLKELRVSAPRHQHLHNIYFDTPQLDLSQLGYALRLRRIGKRWLQTLKGGGSMEGGLHRRDEWEVEVKRPALDLAGLPDAQARAVLIPFADQLEALFTTDFWRTTWVLQTPAGDCIELALDQGEITSGERQCAISEVELELKSGDPAHLFHFGLDLQAQIPLRPEAVNKAARGYALYLGSQSEPQHAAVLSLMPDAPLASSLQAIVWNCMAQMQGNEAGLLNTNNPEFLHQFRVGLRRLRVALGLFRLASTQALPASLWRELEWLVLRLGPARDWDVCVSQTLPLLCGEIESSLAAAMLRIAETQRKRAIGAARRAVASRRYARLMLRLAAWLAGGSWQALPAFQVASTDFAQGALAHRQQQVRRRGKAMARPKQRHAMRIAVKKLRYTSEFFATLYAGRKMQRYSQRLTTLQDVLGLGNDLAVAKQIFAELARCDAGSVRQAVGMMRPRMSKLAKRQSKLLDTAWRKFSTESACWERE